MSFSFRSVCRVSRLCNAVPKTAVFVGRVSYSNTRCFSSDTSAPAPTPTPTPSENKPNSVVKKFWAPSIFQDWNSSIFQHWKNKLYQEKESCGHVDAQEKESTIHEDAAKEKTVSAINLALNSVVKVFTVSSKPRLLQPWQTSMQSECTGSGFVISGRKILTNAHVVTNHKSVKVRRHGSPTKYKAKVRAIGHECDLAILEIDSQEFWEGMNFLELGDIPSLQDAVAVVGYPLGGDSISITNGVVSRVEPIEYSHSSTELLAIQIDAAINSGNSGGPVIMGNKVAGVAFESLWFSDNIGYIIPTPVIKHFLNGVEESGQHVSFCSMDLSYQLMENAQIRSLFKMSDEMTGILINKINPLSDAHRVLKKDDVILAIDGVSIGNDGEVHFRNQERINFKHLVTMKKPSEPALIKVLREGKEYEFNVSLKPAQKLVPVHQFDKLPSYYIFGGLVFIPLSEPYIYRSFVSESVLKKMPRKAGEQIVIISHVLHDDINTEYDSFEDLQVEKVNGVQVDNLKHLCQLIEECCTKELRLDLEDEKVIGFNYRNAKKATSKILKELKIPSAMSEDLQPKLLRRRIVPRQSKKK